MGNFGRRFLVTWVTVEAILYAEHLKPHVHVEVEPPAPLTQAVPAATGVGTYGAWSPYSYLPTVPRTWA
jgi:hypothetical protein